MKTNTSFIKGIGSLKKNFAEKVIGNEEVKERVKSLAQQKMPKLDLENFSELSTKLAGTLKNLSNLSDRILGNLSSIRANEQTTEELLNRAAQLELYQKFFKLDQVIVDENFYRYLIEKGINKESSIDAKQVLIEYLQHQIQLDQLQFGEILDDVQVGTFIVSMKNALKQENWIAASHLLHTYIDLLTQQLFREFTYKDKQLLESYLEEKPRAQFAKKNRLALTNSLKDVEQYQENMSNEEAEVLLPLVFVQIACTIYDSFPAKISRNAVVHFNCNVAFDEIDMLYVFKHIQIAKVLEQQLPMDKEYIFQVLETLHK